MNAAGCVLGAVLCGGASRRMGTDKARVELGGRALLARAAETLAGAADVVVLASGPRARYAELGLEEVPDRRPGAGPLAGLETALAAACERGCARVLVLACDMPRVDAALLRSLASRARERDLDVLLVRTHRGVEPLLGAYSVRCLPAVSAALDAGERRAVAFHGRAVEGPPLRIASATPAELGADPEAARNLNTPGDLQRERADPRFRGGFRPGGARNPGLDRL